MVAINSLAAFRRFLAQPGATAQIVRHDWSGQPFFGKVGPEFSKPGKVKKLQTNGVCFDRGPNGVWLYWDRNASKRFRFDGTDLVTVVLNAERNEVMQYRCWIEGEAASAV